MNALDDVCAHGNPLVERVRNKLKPGYCAFCKRDEKAGAAWAQDQMNTDPVFREEVLSVAREIFIKGRQERCKEAIMAATRNRASLERSIMLGEGVWWEELSPLTPAERGLVIEDLKTRWGIRQHTLN